MEGKEKQESLAPHVTFNCFLTKQSSQILRNLGLFGYKSCLEAKGYII